MKGTVVFKSANIGSKSEGTFPYLELENGEFIKIKLRGDNPFKNTKLREYENSAVNIEGEFNDNKTFMISEIEKIEITPATDEPIAEVELKETEEKDASEDINDKEELPKEDSKEETDTKDTTAGKEPSEEQN